MKFVIGGAYQGKLDFAKEKYAIADNDVFDCKVSSVCDDKLNIDFNFKCIDNLEEFTYACVQHGIEPLDYFKAHEEEWKDSVIICDDIFCGVVPLGAELREWRQCSGRLCKYLSQEADAVTRVFCGLEQKLK